VGITVYSDDGVGVEFALVVVVVTVGTGVDDAVVPVTVSTVVAVEGGGRSPPDR
jgi:hypothetical protein